MSRYFWEFMAHPTNEVAFPLLIRAYDVILLLCCKLDYSKRLCSLWLINGLKCRFFPFWMFNTTYQRDADNKFYTNLRNDLFWIESFALWFVMFWKRSVHCSWARGSSGEERLEMSKIMQINECETKNYDARERMERRVTGLSSKLSIRGRKMIPQFFMFI